MHLGHSHSGGGRSSNARERSQRDTVDVRERSRSHERQHDRPRKRKDRSRSKSHSRSRSRDQDKSLPGDASFLTEADYFLRHVEFVEWLRKDKGKYFNELNGEKARSYFRKFMKAWNRGRLSQSYYSSTPETSHAPASSTTAYKWSFATKGTITRSEREAIDGVRGTGTSRYANAVDDSAFDGPALLTTATSNATVRTPRGPTLPNPGDLTLAHESAESARLAELSVQRKRARADERERVDDMLGSKPIGREGQLEKKRARRENDRAARDQKDDAMGDWDDGVLMGSGDADSFKAKIAQRDAAKRRAEERKGVAERDGAVRERQGVMREKDRATMEMLKKMAKERFG